VIFDSLLGDVITGTRSATLDISAGDTVGRLLGSIGINGADIHGVERAMRPTLNISRLRSGTDRLKVEFEQLSGTDEPLHSRLISLEVIRSPILSVHAIRTDEGFDIVEERRRTRAINVAGSGTLQQGQSLIQVATANGIPYNVVDKFYEIFSFDIDFERDIHPGDRFQVMYEQLYSSTGEYLGPGELLHASLYSNARRREFKLYRFENGSGRVAYYNEQGHGAGKTIKKTPINGARVSSKFGMRRHPVLGFSRAHKGTDFAAPTGTPIPSAGEGVITRRGWDSGYGNFVQIKHNGTYSTLYAHMSRFQSGLKVGSRVRQGQTIGFVGSTGVSTGPHLHYEIIKDGVQVNPLTIRLPSIENLKSTELEAFASLVSRKDSMLAYIENTPAPTVLPPMNEEDIAALAALLMAQIVAPLAPMMPAVPTPSLDIAAAN